MLPSWFRAAAAAGWLALGATCVAACQDATQVRLSVHTNVAATPDLQAALWVVGRGVPLDKDRPTSRIPVAWDEAGRMGDVIAVPPEGAEGASVTAVAVLSRGVAPEQCLVSGNNPACAVARRSFAYQRQGRVHVPLGLYAQCFGVSCPEGDTCNYEGRCVSATVTTSNCPEESGCLIAGEPPVPPGVQGKTPPPGPTPPQPAALLPPSVLFRDEDPAPGFVRGKLVLTPPVQVAPISGYRAFYIDAAGNRIATAREWPGTSPSTWELLPGTQVPSGAEFFEFVASDGLRESPPVRVRADNYPRSVNLELDVGVDALLESHPVVLQGPTGPVLLVVGINTSQRVSVRRCAVDGALCTRHDLGPPGRFGPAFATTSVASSGTRLYVADTDPDGRTLLHICDAEVICTTRDLSLGVLRQDGYGMRLVLDSARGRLLFVRIEPGVLSVDAKLSVISCDLDGLGCSRRGLVMPATTDYDVQVDPPNGDLIVVATDMFTGGERPVRVWRCAADGSACAGQDVDEASPAAGRCGVTTELIPGTRTLVATAQVGGCDQVSTSSGIFTLRCDLATNQCARGGLGEPGDLEPHVIADAARGRLLLSTRDAAQGAVAVRTCGFDFSGCQKTVVGKPEISSEIRLARVPASGLVYATARIRARGSVTALTRCAPDLTSCVFADIVDGASKLSRGDNGIEPMIAADGSGALGLASASEDEATASICRGTKCALAFRVKGLTAAVAHWKARGAFAFGIRQLLPGGTYGLGVAVCRAGDSVCNVEDAALGHEDAGRRPLVLPDAAGVRFTVLHETTKRGVLEPALTTCDDKATNCSLRLPMQEAGGPSATHFGVDAKRGSDDSIWISSVSDGQVRLTRCNGAASGCTQRSIGLSPGAPEEQVFFGSSVLPRPSGADVVVGQRTGATWIACNENEPCSSRPLPIHTRAGEAPWWVAAARDESHGAVYVALFRDGRARREFLYRRHLYAALELYRCDDQGARCERAMREEDVFAAMLYEDESLPGGALNVDGRAPSLSIDASTGTLRLTATSAADLVRPLVRELDTY